MTATTAWSADVKIIYWRLDNSKLLFALSGNLTGILVQAMLNPTGDRGLHEHPGTRRPHEYQFFR